MVECGRLNLGVACLIPRQCPTVQDRPGPWDLAVDTRVERVELALARLQRSIATGTEVCLQLEAGHDGELARDVVVGAGFEIVDVAVRQGGARVRATRARTLPDFVAPDMGVLVCGLNPSVYAADAGVGFARPGNRFWPGALAARLVSVDRDPWHALGHHRVGLTDLVKRATPAAAGISAAEYRTGLARVERLCRRLGPAVVLFVGLAGWRVAADGTAAAGWQQRRLGSSAVYVMPSTSGLNAHTQLPEVVEHMRAVARGAPARGSLR